MAPVPNRRLGSFVVLLYCAAAASGLHALSAASRGIERAVPPRAIGAVLDLSDWDFRHDGPVRLAGEWEFYPGRLLRSAEMKSPAETRAIPDRWRGAEAGGTAGMGAGTYRLRVLLGSGGLDLGIRVPTVSTAFELDANGVMIGRAGKPALLAGDAKPGCFTGICRVPAPASSGELELVVRVSNHEYRTGGMWSPFLLGIEESLRADKRLEDGLTLAFFGVAFSTALVFFLLFRFRRRELGHLYFASFALTIALRTLVTGDYLLASIVPALPFHALIRLTYLTAFASFPLVILFFGRLFPEEIPARALAWACVPFCVLGLALAAPLPLLTRSIYVLYPLLAVMITLMVFGLGRAALHRRPGSGLMLATSIVLGVAGICDMLSTSLILRIVNLLFPALLVFIFAQTSVLAKRFAAAFDSVERLSSELVRANDGLDRQVRERTRELEDAYAQIKELSVKDPLTGAFNRRYLDMELLRETDRALRYDLPLSVLFTDFDHFKAINDRYGHGAGDEVLRAFSRIVLGAIRSNVDWLARYGGEEFLVVLPGTRPRDAGRLAERLRARAEAEAAETESCSIPYTLSIGVAGLDAGAFSSEPGGADAGEAAAALVARADEAMYAAKAAGRNRVELARDAAGPFGP